MQIVQLDHPTDPRWVIIEGELPEKITIEDLGHWTYGKAMIMQPGPVDVVYETRELGVWVKP
jgi:hypothetical protein